MKILIKNGCVYREHQFEQTDILIDHGRIAAVGATADDGCAAFSDVQVYDADGCYVTPGFIDVHTHGAYGVDVNAADSHDYEKIGHFFALEGTTSWLCSVLTDTEEQTKWCIKEARKHYDAQRRNGHGNHADLLGIHLEGPFLASEYKGAMPEHLLRMADMELLRQYQETADGLIRYITVSPEVAGIPEAIPEMVRMGIKVAIGHSGADYNTSWQCIHNGAVSTTHIFNAMRLFHQHEPAIMGAAMESDIYCEAICDGKHLHPGTVRLLLKTKGYDRVIAITDSIMATGLPDGEYRLGVNEVIVRDRDAKLKSNGVRAGSVLTTGRAFRNLMDFTGAGPERILPLLTENPAKMLGVWEQIGSIDIGKDADILIMDKDYQILDTLVKGRKIERSLLCH